MSFPALHCVNRHLKAPDGLLWRTDETFHNYESCWRWSNHYTLLSLALFLLNNKVLCCFSSEVVITCYCDAPWSDEFYHLLIFFFFHKNATNVLRLKQKDVQICRTEDRNFKCPLHECQWLWSNGSLSVWSFQVCVDTILRGNDISTGVRETIMNLERILKPFKRIPLQLCERLIKFSR